MCQALDLVSQEIDITMDNPGPLKTWGKAEYIFTTQWIFVLTQTGFDSKFFLLKDKNFINWTNLNL